jgi:hypothetical protein
MAFGTANLGAFHGLKVIREMGAKYWILTHNEIVTGTRGYSWFLMEREIGLDEALEQDRKEKGDVRETRGFEFTVVGNGESLVLE